MVDVTGAWSLSLTNMSGSGMSCDWAGATMNLTQSGATFTGSYSGGTLTCRSGGQSASEQVGGGSIVNGTVNGSKVTFEIDSPDMPMTGKVSGESMSGTGMLRYDLGSPYGVVTLNGNWAAVRK
jgi:hypothetical protein